MINVGEAFKWDLLGSERYMGELAKRYPPRAVNKLTPVIKDIHIKNFIVESADRILSINGIPEIPCSNVLIENGQINSLKLIDAMNDVDGFTMRNIKIKAQDNKINILDGRNILFDNVEFTVPNGEIITNIKGEKSKNIIVQTEPGKDCMVQKRNLSKWLNSLHNRQPWRIKKTKQVFKIEYKFKRDRSPMCERSLSTT